jgi:hypothetical protein
MSAWFSERSGSPLSYDAFRGSARRKEDQKKELAKLFVM